MSIINASNANELHQALANARGGDVIKLASGNYGNLNLDDISFASNVTINSLGSKDSVTFTGLNLHDVSNLTIGDVTFDYEFTAGDPSYVSPFNIEGGNNVTIRRSAFDGDVARGTGTEADGYGYGTGLTVTDAQNVRVTGNTISNFYNGLYVSESQSVTIARNDVHDIRSDGMDFAQVDGLVIDNNHLHDFRTASTSLDHPDMIQFWTAGSTAPSTNIVIKNNLLDAGDGHWTQAIFMGNELAGAGPSMYYRDVTIANNVVVNGHFHGISVGETINLNIDHNTVLHTDGSAPDGQDSVVEIPQINVSPLSENVTVRNNLTGGVTGFSDQGGWYVGNNFEVQDQDPNQPNFYGDLFISSSLTPKNGVHMFLATSGGLIDLAGAGASGTRTYLPEAGAVASLFEATVNPSGSVQSRVFDASLSLGDRGELPDNAVFNWDFGDGTTARGEKVTHNFNTGGYYDVKLTVSLPDGTSDTTTGVIGVQNTDLLRLGDDGKLLIEDHGKTVVLPGGGNASGLHLGGAGVAALVPDAFISNITRVHDFDVVMELTAGSTSSFGEVFRLNGGLTASVTAEGAFQLEAIDGAGHKILLTSGAVTMTDMRAHDIDVRSTDGQLQLWVDGQVRSSAAFSGAINSFGPTDMTFGNPWGAQNFFGDITAFEVKVGENALGQSNAAPGGKSQAVTDLALADAFDFAPAKAGHDRVSSTDTAVHRPMEDSILAPDPVSEPHPDAATAFDLVTTMDPDWTL